MKPQVVTIQNPRDGKTIQAVKVDDSKAGGVKVADVDERAAKNATARQERDRAAAQSRNDQAKAMTQANLDLLDRVHVAMANAERTAEDLRAVVLAALAGSATGPHAYSSSAGSMPTSLTSSTASPPWTSSS